MKDNNSELVIKLLLMIELITLILGCMVLYELAPDAVGILCFACVISASVFTFSIVQYAEQKKLRRLTDEVTNALYCFRKDVTVDTIYIQNNTDLSNYYKTLKSMKETFIKQEEDRQQILNIVNSVAANMEIETLLDALLPKLIDVTDSNCCAFYLVNHTTNKLEIKKSIGFSKNVFSEFDISIGEGLIGQAASNNEIKMISPLPDDTIYITRTYLGKIKPKSMLVVPVISQDVVVGVFAFASINEYSDNQLEMVNLIKYYVGVAVGNCIAYEKTKRMTNELKFQNRLIQNLNEHLEQKVRDRTICLNDTIDLIPDYGIYVTDRSGMIVVWNKGAERLFGIGASEAIGNTIQQLSIRNLYNGYTGWRFNKDGYSYFVNETISERVNQLGEITGYMYMVKDKTYFFNKENKDFLYQFYSNETEQNTNARVLTNEMGIIEAINKTAFVIFPNLLLPGKCIYQIFSEHDNLNHAVEMMQSDETIAKMVTIYNNQEQFGLHITKLENDEKQVKKVCFNINTQ